MGMVYSINSKVKNLYIKDNGLKITCKARALKSGGMDLITKVNIKKDKSMARDSLFGKTEVVMKVNLLKIN